MPAIEVPDVLKPYGVIGIFVGGCVQRGDGSSFRAQAHAHSALWSASLGWICIRSAKRVFVNGSNKPSTLLWHETAHIWRRSWSHEKIKNWANKQVRNTNLEP